MSKTQRNPWWSYPYVISLLANGPDDGTLNERCTSEEAFSHALSRDLHRELGGEMVSPCRAQPMLFVSHLDDDDDNDTDGLYARLRAALEGGGLVAYRPAKGGEGYEPIPAIDWINYTAYLSPAQSRFRPVLKTRDSETGRPLKPFSSESDLSASNILFRARDIENFIDKPELPGAELQQRADRPLANASESKIRESIRRIYKDAKVKNEKPPNVREIIPLVQESLEAEGAQASGRRIQELADESEFKNLRWPTGRRRKERF